MQPFQGWPGFGCVTQGSSFLATHGLNDAIPLGLRNPGRTCATLRYAGGLTQLQRPAFAERLLAESLYAMARAVGERQVQSIVWDLLELE